MSEDTGPSELAELLKDDEKRKAWMIFTLQGIKNDLKQHIDDDSRQFKELFTRVGGVSSAVKTERERNTYTLKEMVAGFLILCGALGGLITFIAWAIGNAGKGAP